jgi:glyoxylase-like metal-dependent hydrolase (beta-lactamase superfamily II)
MTPGVACALSPMVRRIVAPNPSVMTGPGTNTYLVGVDEIAVIDPGPTDESHLDAIMGAGGDRIRWILVTHTHTDHSPGAVPLKERTGAEVLGFGFAKPASLDHQDSTFAPDRLLADGDHIDATEFRLTAVYTPGHASNHLCYVLEQERLLFSGDHIMNGSTVIIAPLDGDMSAYLQALDRVGGMRVKAIAPGHGELIEDPKGKIDEYVNHRLAREAAVAKALGDAGGPAKIADLVKAVYTDVPESRHMLAQFSLWAHLRKLAADGRAKTEDSDKMDGVWESIG